MPARSLRSILRPLALLLLLAWGPTPAEAEVPETSSPGGLARAAEVASLCPTFSWGVASGAARLELVVLDLAVPDSPTVVLRRELSGKSSSWTPDRVDCLRPGGSYGWTLRSLDATGRAVDGENGWAAVRRFTVPALPSASEVDAAMEVLRRWQEGGESAMPSASSASATATASSSRLADRASTAGQSAIVGENPAVSGFQHGIWGQTASASGAGLVGANLAGGPDLVLEGAAQGQVDTIVTQSGIDRPSASSQTFNIENSGAGAMALQVDGAAVSLAGHLHAGEEIASGTVADARVASTLTRDDEVMTIVLYDDGPGSTLNADLLDGLHGQNFQRRVTGVCAAGETLQGINVDGSVVCAVLGGPPTATTVTSSIAETFAYHTSIAVGADGLPVVSFYNMSRGALAVLKCNDAACDGLGETISWVDDPATGVGKFSAIAIGADGFPVISYFDEASSSLKVAKCNDAACSGGDETTTTVDNPANVVGKGTDIAIGTDGFPVICYFDETAAALKVAKCNDVACAGNNETITTVDDPVDAVGQFCSIAIAWTGNPYISYFDETEGGLKLMSCNDAACSGGGEPSTLVDAPDGGSVGHYTSLGISPIDGKPVISYYDATNSALKVAKCTDFGCIGTNKVITMVDNSADVGEYSALAFGDDGLPVISYYDATITSLKVVRCNDIACTGDDESIVTALNPTGTDVGKYNAIAIGADGYPVISLIDDTYDEVRVLKCHSRSCLAP
ncbi:MAG: hypothetical protein IPJ17_17905 [Holophagales bacterium]|nr:MAG: hypothetical protein IPJ17_17905 [Holophagales bacterium]